MSNRRRFIAVYMMANWPFAMPYIGVTNDLWRRTQEHREGTGGYFTRKYALKMLVWYQQHELMTEAIAHEKRLKHWNRMWKMALIEKTNPEWVDLWPFLSGAAPDPRVKPEDDDAEKMQTRVERWLKGLDGRSGPGDPMVKP